MPTTADLITQARATGATVLETHGATIIVIARPALAERLSVADVAKLAACPEKRVRVAARLGELPGSELGERSLSFARSDVIAWLERNPIRTRAPRDEATAEDEADARYLETLLSEAN